MKPYIVGLLLFGVVAAVCAALLVASLRASSRPRRAPPQVEFMVAAQNLPRSVILNPDSVTTKTLPITEAPEGHLSNTVQVLGKVLAIPMVEGQPFTRSCFASENSGYRVASVLPDGMRAITLTLTGHSGLYGLLYAGCIVDVLTTFSMAKGQWGNEAMTKPLLQGVQVLAVEGETLISGGSSSPEGKRGGGRAKNFLVTVMVDLEQAAVLQLAMQYGVVSLALRNPMDKSPVKLNQALLSQLTRGEFRGLINMGTVLREAATAFRLPDVGNLLDGVATALRSPTEPEEPEQPEQAEELEKNFWEVTVIRGAAVTTESVLLPPDDENVPPEVDRT